MTAAHLTLLNLLAVERLEVDLFRGSGQGGETPTRIFGGQVIGQALASAYHTVEKRLCHSLHAYSFVPATHQFQLFIKSIELGWWQLYNAAGCGNPKWKTDLEYVSIISR